MPRVFVTVRRLLGRPVDANEAGILRVAACNGMIFQIAEASCEGYVVRARQVLVAQEEHPVFQQCRPDFSKQSVVVHGLSEFHVY
ncbi:hypothetical protein BN2476_690016 [Paraburkholderia piptadeniae]|uniref:Uncharacterized protein n=1 Tax=Paraburkholderia piptadeniae TaxID=1701573 RepID=A0A1N7SQG8_9BURK|nr:hypothetical protein BN2476_690016 [Paraburkholderia piptadeniae]